jgi:hypothetical protein
MGEVYHSWIWVMQESASDYSWNIHLVLVYSFEIHNNYQLPRIDTSM